MYIRLSTSPWHMARILTWLLKWKGKHICSAKPAPLDFDKPAQIALAFHCGLGCESASVTGVLQTQFYLPWMQWEWEEKDRQRNLNEEHHEPVAAPSHHDAMSEVYTSEDKKDLHVLLSSGGFVYQCLWEEETSKSGSVNLISKGHLGDFSTYNQASSFSQYHRNSQGKIRTLAQADPHPMEGE